MLKFTNYDVVFREIPDETTLAINIANCPNRCPSCHTPELQTDIGQELTSEILDYLIEKHEGITCVCLMGGDNDPEGVMNLLVGLSSYRALVHPDKPYIKTAWYSGRSYFPELWPFVDYIKIGHYDEKLGPLNSPSTNQRLFKIKNEIAPNVEDITMKFWEHAE